jgi:predicted nucleic acid-binding protein
VIVVDTGVLYASVDSSDNHHQASVDLLRTEPGPLIVPITVVVETSFLVERHLGAHAEATYLRELRSSGVSIDRLTDADLDRIAELVDTYHDLPLGAVDASVVAVAERHRATTIATLDWRHFTVVRPAHTSHFELLP